MGNDEEVDEYHIDKPICCSVRTFFMINCCWLFVALALILFGVLGIVLTAEGLLLFPDTTFFVAIGFGGFAVLVIAIGMFGQKQTVELCFLFYILFVSLGLIGQILAYSFLLLYINDLGFLTLTDGSVDTLNTQETVATALTDFALGNPDLWKDFQDKLECCGIEFESVFEAGFESNQAVLESGAACSSQPESQTVANLRVDANFNDREDFDSNENFIPALIDGDIGADQEFFCKHKAASVLSGQLPVIGAILGLILLLQVSGLVAAARMYWVPEFLGGWQFNDEEMEIVAKRKGIPLPKNADDFKGNRVLSAIRAGTDRASFRVRNAYTADPDVPRSEGFVNRFSASRVTSGWRGMAPEPGQGNPVRDGDGGTMMSPPLPNRGPAGMFSPRMGFLSPKSKASNTGSNFMSPRSRVSNERNPLKRISQRMFNFGGSGYMDTTAPPGLMSPPQSGAQKPPPPE